MRVPKYRCHSVRDRGFVEIDGARHYLPGPFNSRESRAAYQAMIAERFGNRALLSAKPTNQGYTVDELIADFLDYCESTFGRSSSVYKCDKSMSRDWLAWGSGVPVADLGPLAIRRLQDRLVGRGLARSTVNHSVARFRFAVRWAVSQEKVSAVVSHALGSVGSLRPGRTTAVELPARTPVAWEHVETTLMFLPQPFADMVRFQWWTGQRSRNVCDATTDEFDRSSDPWTWRPKQHKTASRGKSLVVWIGPRARQVIADRFSTEGPLFRKSVAQQNAINGSGYRTSSYYAAIKEAREAAKAAGYDVPPWTSHQLRYARSTHLAAMHGLEAAQATIGHASIDSTQIYSSRLADVARRIAESDC